MGFRCLMVMLIFVTHWFGTPSVALECSNLPKTKTKTCDDCIKCGGVWCNNVQESQKCVSLTGGRDDWCPNPDDREIVYVNPKTRDGTVFRPQYEEMVVEINTGKITTLLINGPVKDIHSVYNTTGSVDNSKVYVDTNPLTSKIEVTTRIQEGFCLATSQTIEHVFVNVIASGVEEKAVLKYHVPCACACSLNVEPHAPACSGFGDLICGSCRCYPGRRGEHCECGKASSSCVGNSITKCSGNGICDKCNTCQCNERVNIPGTERYDPQNNCKDIITSTVSDFFGCLKNSEAPCGTCDLEIAFQKYDETLLGGGGNLWVNMKNATGRPYWASRVNGKIQAMREPKSPC